MDKNSDEYEQYLKSDEYKNSDEYKEYLESDEYKQYERELKYHKYKENICKHYNDYGGLGFGPFLPHTKEEKEFYENKCKRQNEDDKKRADVWERKLEDEKIKKYNEMSRREKKIERKKERKRRKRRARKEKKKTAHQFYHEYTKKPTLSNIDFLTTASCFNMIRICHMSSLMNSYHSGL